MGNAGDARAQGGQPAGATRRAQRRGQVALLVAVAALVGFLPVLVAVLLGDTKGFDVGVTHTIQCPATPLVLGLMEAVSWPGYKVQMAVIGLAAAGLLLWRGLRLEGGFALLALLASLTYLLLKEAVGRPRPASVDGVLIHGADSGTSFPSGHVLAYLIVFGYLAYLAATLLRPPPLRVAALAALLALIVLVGPSRVYLGQHWPTDVLASYFLGTALLIALLTGYRGARARQLARAGAHPAAA